MVCADHPETLFHPEPIAVTDDDDAALQTLLSARCVEDFLLRSVSGLRYIDECDGRDE